ncbi:MAG TPA: hypothetical protein VK789_19375 [Bryobacteraceae bacterium]|nr:hypothetical protein [Bryobacteraceae bacterium]
MGILRFPTVDEWQRAATKERREAMRDPDDAGPIGARAPSPATHTATWIRLDRASGQLIYGPEKKIEVYKGQDKELPEDLQQKMGMREIRGWLFQVRKTGPNPQPDSFALFEGKDILLSKLPHSRNYFVRRKLKRCKHEKAVWSQVARAWEKYAEIQLADERLDRLLQELSVTPFLHSKDCLAAWAVVPQRFAVLGDERFDTADDYTIAALDIPLEEAIEWLKTDPAIQAALAATENGRLFDGYQSVRDLTNHVVQGFRRRSGPIRFPVTAALRERKEELMEAACWAALCGREVRDAKDSVAQSAVLLYHRFAYNFVDRKKNPHPPISEDQQNEPQGECSGFEWSESFAEEQLTRESTDQWRELGQSAAAMALPKIIEHVLNAQEDRIDEEFVHTMRPALAGWPSGWKRPESFDQALKRLNKPRS